MTKIEKATRWMEDLARDNSHGYAWGGWGPQDYDCGHAIITALEDSGIPAKSRGATFTGDMYPVLRQLGFVDVIGQVNLANGNGIRRGDILLNEASHAAIATGNGKLVHARSSEGNSIPGDQSGNEIREQNYFNYPWTRILRGPEEKSEEGEKENEEMPALKPKEKSYLHIEPGDGMNAPVRRVRILQELLNEHDALGGQAMLDEDGEFGKITELAVRQFQKKRGLEVNGIVDELVWEELIQFEI